MNDTSRLALLLLALTFSPFLLVNLSKAAALENKLNAEPIQLASTYDSNDNIEITDYFISEKLDGIRARWTGTQLLTRNGNIIHAPSWFTVNWPNIILDGELWTQRGSFERIASIVLSDTPDERWQHIKMMLFDAPAEHVPFALRVAKMQAVVAQVRCECLAMIPQFTLHSLPLLEAKIDDVTAAGGEGLMLHHRDALYRDGRSHHLLKAKRFEDAEAKVIAYIGGKGKFSGMMGSLLVETRNGVQFKIGSGFNLHQRQLPPPIGSWITFKYYGLTNAGIPRFASFKHVRPEKDRP